MKKYLAIFPIVLIIFFLLSLTVYNRSYGATPFDNAYQEYSLEVEEYRKAHDEYVLARSQYLKFGTLTSTNNAKDAAIVMLQTRDDVVISYFKAVKEKAAETRGIPDATRDALNIRIDEETNWFSDHRGRLSSAGSLDDIVKDSDEASMRFESVEPLIYEALSDVASGKISRFRERLNETFSSVSTKVGEIREEERDKFAFSTRKLELIDRWIFETENRITRSEEKQAEAEAKIMEFSGEKKRNVPIYNEVLSTLAESQQYLNEASLFVKEIIREIKTAE